LNNVFGLFLDELLEDGESFFKVLLKSPLNGKKEGY
jgi:hypothetical protein